MWHRSFFLVGIAVPLYLVVCRVTGLGGNYKAINPAGVWLSTWGRGELAGSFCPVSGESRVPFVAALAGV